MKTINQFLKKSVLILFLVVSSNILNAQINRQQQSMWCWASCIQSSLYQGNVNVSQVNIVSRLTGWPQNRPASINEVISVLRSYNFKARSVSYPANPQQLYNTLSSGWKVIAFVNPTNNSNVGHFIMLQGIAQNGSIIVSDPTYGNTYQQNIKDLYYGWKWSRSIVVGTP
jgi:ABC-type bacteriocin/lantibiotic exporter with double-glycine peptidase domain